MANSFDPYHQWLDIPSQEQPPHHYRLLGIEPFQHDPETINAAADERMVCVKRYQNTYPDDSQDLLDALSRARVCLLDATKQASYDRQLRLDNPALRSVPPPVRPPGKPATPTAARESGAAETVPSAPLPRSRHRLRRWLRGVRFPRLRLPAMAPVWDALRRLRLPRLTLPRGRWRSRPTHRRAIYAAAGVASLVAITFAGWFFFGDSAVPLETSQGDEAAIPRSVTVAAPNPVLAPTPVLAPKPDPAPKPALPTEPQVTVNLGDGVTMKLVRISAGEFMMGSDAASDEKPRHRVRITKPFYLSETEVTQRQYEKLTGSNPSNFTGAVLDAPVEQVSWDDAQDFCRKLSELRAEKKAGRRYRLPTEAQWEYACRAGSAKRYCYGDDESSLGDYAWYHKNSGSKTHQVGQKKPNAWGLYDMHGNVWEWCEDWYARGYYANSPTDDPTGYPRDSSRVHRGGGWGAPAAFCRSASRTSTPPGRRFSFLGFRLAASINVAKLKGATGEAPPPKVEPAKATILDQLDPKDIPPSQLLAAATGDATKPPPHHVRIFGDGRWMHWHKIHASAIVFSPNGETIATCSWDGTVRLWNVKSGDLERVFESSIGGVSAIAWHAKYPQRIFAASNDQTSAQVFAINVSNGQWQKLYQHANDSCVSSLDVSPNGELLVSAGVQKACWYSLKNNKQIRDVQHPGIRCAAVSRDGKLVATAGGDSVIRVWDRSTGAEVDKFVGTPGEFYNSITFTPDGRGVVVGLCNGVGLNGRTRLWILGDKRWARVLPSDGGYVWSVQFSPDGKWMAAGRNRAQVSLWNANTWKLKRTFNTILSATYTEAGKRSVAFSSDSKLLASGGADNAIHLWDIATEKTAGMPVFGRLHSVALHPSAKYVVAGGDKGKLGVWDLNNDEKHIIAAHAQPIRCVAFSPNGNVLASAGDDGVVRFWDCETAKAAELQPIRLNQGKRPAGVMAIAFHPTAPTIALASAGGTVSILNWKTGASQFEIKETVDQARSLEVLSVAFSGDGELFATGGAVRVRRRHAAGMLRIRKSKDALLVTSVPFVDAVHAIAFHPDKPMIAVVSIERAAEHRTIQLANARRVLTLVDLSGRRLFTKSLPVSNVAFSHDGSRLVLAGVDGKVRILDLQTYEIDEIKIGPRRGVIAQAIFGPNDRHIITANHNGTVSVLRLENNLPK